MTPETFDKFWLDTLPELTALLKALQSDIGDDYRSPHDEPDSEPKMQITISCNEDCTQWSYQTGDNSSTGSCYMHPYWGISSLYRDDKPEQVARALVESLGEAIDFE